MLELGRIPCLIPSKMLKQMEEKLECTFLRLNINNRKMLERHTNSSLFGDDIINLI